MPITIFGQNKIYSANAFASSFLTDGMYLYVGKSYAWANDANPPTSTDITSDKNKIWDNMSGAIRVTRDQVSLGIKRNNWTSGTVYEKYTHSDSSLGDGNGFYVLAGYADRDVYKCLDNNGGSASTSKPTHYNSGPTREADGYVWKYMYHISTTAFSRFATANIIPVIENGKSRQYSIPGSIPHLPISANNSMGIGKWYRGTGHSNGSAFPASAANATIYTTIPANTATNEIRIAADSGLPIFDDYFSNSFFVVTSGASRGKTKTIIDSKAIGLSSSDDYAGNLVFATAISNIANGDTFMIGPRVSVTDDYQGVNFYGIGDVNLYGNVMSIDVISSGAGYSNGDSKVTIHGDYLATTNAIADGTGASVDIVIPPVGGHGYQSSTELNAKYVIISAETTIPTNHETGSFIGYGNEIRQYGLIKNPISRYTDLPAKEISYDTRTSIYFKSPTSIPFKIGDTVNNGLTSATATGIIDNICGDSGSQYITLTNVTGRFANGDIIYNNKGYNMTIDSRNLSSYNYPLGSVDMPAMSVLGGGLYKYSGEILYNDNISPITRRIDQKENFKIVFEF